MVEYIQGLNLFDILVAFFVAAYFVAGYIQGTLRRLLGLATALLSLLLAINLREPLGGWLAEYWTHPPRQYDVMFAFGVSFIVIFVVGSIAVQTYYRPATVFTKASAIEELVGGILGVVEALVLVGAMILVLDSYYSLKGIPPAAGELAVLRQIYTFYDGSQVAAVFRASLIPFFLALFGLVTPAELRARYP